MQQFFEKLGQNSATFLHLLAGISQEEAQWKPAPEKWSILEVINHLIDEELFDFKVRIDYTLNKPGESWPPIDPKGWVTERKYNERNLDESLENFLNARKESIEWLKTLNAPDLSKSYTHPKIGELKAGDLLVSWLAHDYLHMRQIANLRAELTKRDAAPFSTYYAAPA